MSEKDGGPAFPVPETTYGEWSDPSAGKGWQPYHGMSLRDWFAGLAMQGGISGLLADGSKISPDDDMRPLAEIAYGLADAMLAERGKP